MPKQLVKPVYAGGQWWAAGAEPPQEVADTIRNPKAWSTGEDAGAEQASGPARHTGDGPRLAGPVNIGGVWYGPDDEVPADVAARIRNPKAWADGVMPSADKGERSGSAESTAGADKAPARGSDDDPPHPPPAAPTGPERSSQPRSTRAPGRKAGPDRQ